MLIVCPSCEKTTGLEIITRQENFNVKGEDILVQVKLYHCKECNSFFQNKELGDPYKAAYSEYRRIKGMVQPDQIIEFRKKYNLTQKEFGDLLGFGAVTLSRYENGALQDLVHDNILKLAMEPNNFITLLLKSNVLNKNRKREAIILQLKEETTLIEKVNSFLNNTNVDEFNGYTLININKIVDVIKSFCFNRQVFKTKLMKLLFYSDFMHYKNFHKSITGLRYAHLPNGPALDKYELVLGVVMTKDPGIHLEPVEFEKYCGDLVKVVLPTRISHLDEDEIATVNYINSKFEYFTSADISEFSHEEDAYKITNNSELISYNFAKTMDFNKSINTK